MEEEFKLLRLSNGDMIICKIVSEDQNSLTISTPYKLMIRELVDGIVTGVLKWIPYAIDEDIQFNKDHVSLITKLKPNFISYIKRTIDSDNEMIGEEDFEEYKKTQNSKLQKQMLLFANTGNTVH
jgi:hypothetical protein